MSEIRERNEAASVEKGKEQEQRRLCLAFKEQVLGGVFEGGVCFPILQTRSKKAEEKGSEMRDFQREIKSDANYLS